MAWSWGSLRPRASRWAERNSGGKELGIEGLGGGGEGRGGEAEEGEQGEEAFHERQGVRGAWGLGKPPGGGGQADDVGGCGEDRQAFPAG